jgi:hypothetical protein
MMSGAYQFVEALEAYVGALHKAVVSDVTRAVVNQLTRAEELLRSGAKKMTEAMIIMSRSDAPGGEDILRMLEEPIILIRNLRTLCLDSLKPQNWFAGTTFKFVIVFLVVTVVLVPLVNFTNAEGGFSGILTGYALLMSFVAALVGSFGFEAIRFLPFIDRLSKSRLLQKESDK